MKIKKKDDCLGIPHFNSHSGLSKDNFSKLNNGETVTVDAIPPQAKNFVEEVKSKGK
tara:strand:+ start:629 stop:799 length:171 start_codon:yes stop_codon:yes gene_type:complete